MTLTLQHPFTLIVAGPSSCGKSTFVIRLLECMEQLCDIVFENTVWCHSENNAPHLLKNVSFLKCVPDFEHPEKVPTFIVLDDLMDCLFYKSERIIHQRITTSWHLSATNYTNLVSPRSIIMRNFFK